MLAAVKEREGPGITVRSVESPAAVGNGVLLDIIYAGICGSDLATYRWDPHKAARLAPSLPIVIGHEAIGRVVSADPALTVRFPVGARVALEPINGCLECEQCRRGLSNLCPNAIRIGTNWQGTMAQSLRVPARACHLVPDRLSDEEGALLEVMGVAVHAARSLKDGLAGARTVVIGPGAIGLFLVQVLQAFGVASIALVARSSSEWRLGLGRELGADDSFVVNDPDDIGSALNGRFDVAFEAAGSPTAMVEAVHMTRPGGKVVGLGGYTEDLVLDYSNLARYKGIDLVASRARVPEDWDVMLRLVEYGKLRPGPIPIEVIPLREATKAFDRASERSVGKVLLDCR